MNSDSPQSTLLADAVQDIEAIFDLTIVGLIRVKNRVIVRCNRQMEELFGYERGEMMGQSTRILYRNEDEFLAIGDSAYADAAQGRIHSREQHFHRKDGSEFWGRIAGRAVDPQNPFDCVLLIENTTERKLADERLRSVLHEQQLIFENAAVGIVFFRDSIVQRCNQRGCQILGYSAEELLNRSAAHLFERLEKYEEFNKSVLALIMQDGKIESEFQLLRKDGQKIWVQATGRRIEKGDSLLHVLWIFEDVTERHLAQIAREQYEEKLENQVAERTKELASAYLELKKEILERNRAEERVWYVANHDSLTNFPNRALFQDRLEHALAHAHRRHNKAALISVDIDRFKAINEAFGHRVGDLVLQEAANRLKKIIRSEDSVARFGGDEFVVLLGDMKNSDDLFETIERLRSVFYSPVILDGKEIHVTLSVGASIFPDDASDKYSLMRHADTALYHAKASGRNSTKIFDVSMDAGVSSFFELESHLSEALEKNELRLFYQPIVEATTRRLTGVEALIRWYRAGKFISPGEFIPIAEESGLILTIGNWVLREACRQAVCWQKAGFRDLTMAVNLSARQFREPDLAAQIGQILRESGLPPKNLELEITETTLMDQVDDTLKTLEDLSEMGVSIAVDDFGTGYSSLSYLKRFPVHKLKIDQSFVRDICENGDDAAIVGAIIDLSRNLKLVSHAEGVETEEQLNALVKGGCDVCQGYYFAKPLQASELESLYFQRPW